MMKNIFDVILEENKENLSNKEFVLKHLYIGIQKVSTEECIKRDFGFEGLESYLYVRLDINEGMASAKLNKVMLEELSISEAEAWAQAQLNQHAETTIQPIFSAINNLLDNSVEDSIFDFEEESVGIYVISNKCMNLGASAILDNDVIAEVARRCKTNKLIACPSSKHEMILLPDNGTMDFEEVCELVKHINSTEVAEKDRLTDRAYKLTV